MNSRSLVLYWDAVQSFLLDFKETKVETHTGELQNFPLPRSRGKGMHTALVEGFQHVPRQDLVSPSQHCA